MRFLHTADWHLGRMVRGRSRDDEHRRALQQVLAYAREHQVDCVLVAGDIFDTAAPTPEAERLAYDFFCELYAAGIPGIVIAGNHDHPRRIDALAPLLRALNIRAVGRPVGARDGGVVQIVSRPGQERAMVAMLPWVSDRDAVDFATLAQTTSAPITQYQQGVQRAMDQLAQAFSPDTVNVLVAHCFVDDAIVGPGGGERPLTVSLGIYGLTRQMLPVTRRPSLDILPQYLALGHVHKPQAVWDSPPAWYPGSLLQLDFGEQRQEKFVNLVEAHPGQPASVTQLPIAGRALLDVGSPSRGVHLADLAAWSDQVGDAWLRVFVDAEEPIANLPAVVREHLPNAVHVQRTKPAGFAATAAPSLGSLQPEEIFAAFYRSSLGRGKEPGQATLGLFRELLAEEMNAGP